MNNNLSDFREEYKFEGLNELIIEKDPFILFDVWMKEAIKNKINEPNAMTLATVDKSGKPSARIVLLKGISKKGFVFYTNYKSRKGSELADNPNAALVFWWNILARQVRVEGVIEKVVPEESDAYFKSRPRGSQLGAVVSDQSRSIPSYEYLLKKYKMISEKYADSEIPRPENWGGFRLVPQRIEFWQGRENRLHDRILFKKNKGDDWIIERLSP